MGKYITTKVANISQFPYVKGNWKERRIIIALTSFILFVLGWSIYLKSNPPKTVISHRNDIERIHNIDYLREEIDKYAKTYGAVPEALTKLDIELNHKTDPVSQDLYEYKAKTKNSYEICVEFETDTRLEAARDTPYDPLNNAWKNELDFHPKGKHCVTFETSKLQSEYIK